MDKTVLVYIFNNDKVLMLYRNKKKNDINKGKWVGIGGHIEENETNEEAVNREVKEETNLDLDFIYYHGPIYFKDNDYEEIMYLYSSYSYKGELKECDEGELSWIDINKLFNLNMWEADKFFLEKVLNKETFERMDITYKNGKLISVKM